MSHVELNRCFIEVKEDSFDPNSRRDLARWGYPPSLSWDELLKNQRVVILAEAGMGKTQELQAQAKKCCSQGKVAFFCRIEDLADEGLLGSLTLDDERRFKNWQRSNDEGYFFLDAVDEAKLVGKGFESALRKLARALDTAVNQAFIFVTSRISDWQPQTDLELFNRLLPLPLTKQIRITSVQPVSNLRSAIASGITEEEAPKQTNFASVVELAPLTPKQQRQFVHAAGVNDLDVFMAEIERTNTSIFAERPRDLQELAVYWNGHLRLGSFEAMHEFNVQIKLREHDPDRRRQLPITEERMREGAEMLAAALVLCKKNTLSIPDKQPDSRWANQSIQAQDVLKDWLDKEITALLRAPIFDQQTYGRLRFHHRSIREYLAACWFRRLLEGGAPIKEVEDLFFKEKYGEQVVVPSLRPIVAWLCLWNDLIKSQLLEISPEVLLKSGDSSQLPVETRVILLRRFAKLIIDRKHTDPDIDFAAIQRLSTPALAPVIQELLQQHYDNKTIRSLLLRMIWQGCLLDCAEDALAIALDKGVDAYSRMTAVRSIGVAGSVHQKRQLADSILADISAWESKVLGEAVEVLFPGIITVEQILHVVEQFSLPKGGVVSTGLPHTLEKIAEESLSTQDRTILFERFVELASAEPYIEEIALPVSQQFSWLLPVLARLVARILQNNEYLSDDRILLHSLELVGYAHHYDLLDYQPKEVFQKIVESVRANCLLNHVLFWRSVQRQREDMEQIGNRLTAWYQAPHLGTIWSLSVADFDAFLIDITNKAHPDDHLVALTAAFHIWKKHREDPEGLSNLRQAIGENLDLLNQLDKLLNPIEPEMERWQIKEAQRKHRQEQDREKCRETEQAHIRKLQADHQRLCNPAQVTCPETFNDFYNIVHRMARLGDHSKRGQGNWEALASVFGQQVAEAARDGLQLFWRTYTPSTRSESEGNGITNGTTVGLSGLAIESRQDPQWAMKLTHEEALLAARYATEELNGFPKWVEDLLRTHPNAVMEVFAHELEWQFQLTGNQVQHHVLDKLSWGSEALQNHFLPVVWNLLQVKEPYYIETLERSLTILMRSQSLDRVLMTELARDRYQSVMEEGNKLLWLVVWLFTEANGAIKALHHWVEEAASKEEQYRRMLTFCNALIERYNLRFGSIWRDFERVESLSLLLPLVYTHIRPSDDNQHKGAYTPDARDAAEETRAYLLERLFNTPGRATFDALKCLASSNITFSTTERLHILAYRRAAEDAEPAAWDATDIDRFIKIFVRPLHTTEDLFQLVLNRLENCRRDLEGSDFSEAATLQKTQELAIQNWFASRLRDRAQGFYTVSREEEVVDQKKPDIRIHTPSIGSPITIEIKVADKWTYTELSERLENQLIDQYHRDQRSRFGIYLLTYHGDKKYWVARKKHLYFQQLLSELQQQANKIVRGREDVDKIHVFGIDLTTLRK